MFDYLNEYLIIAGRHNRRSGTYAKARELQARGYAQIFNQLAMEFCGRFKWKYEGASGKGTIATELIERTILYCGACAFFEYEQTGANGYSDKSWRCGCPSGFKNDTFYGQPSTVTICDYRGKNVGVYIPVLREDVSDIANCALVYDNYDGGTPMALVLYYAERLAVINTSIDAALRNILGTTIIKCSHEQADSMRKQREAAATGIPYILEYSDLDIERSRTEIMTAEGSSEVLKTLLETYDKVHADYQQRIGVRANNEIDKKSGVTPIEIIENRQNVDLLLNKSLEARQIGLEMCKKVGLEGLGVSLENFQNVIGDYDNRGNLVSKPEFNDITGGDDKIEVATDDQPQEDLRLQPERNLKEEQDLS